MVLETLQFDQDRFCGLLGKLIGESKYLQNNPPDLVPTEDRAARHVLELLEPYSEDNGGPLQIQHVSYVEGRGNIIVTYPGKPDGGILSFVGAHMDVVTANPEVWDFDPFTLKVEGDQLYGRGTTDCLGHVALLAELFVQLGRHRPQLDKTIVGVWIANEENASEGGIGVDELVKHGLLEHLKEGPLYWVDVADSQPCIGTGGMMAWTLTAHGKLFHSGLPHKAINALELCMDALSQLQAKFYQAFPPHEREALYGFATPSTLKPTQWTYPGGSINQIPGEASISGECRVTPFYAMKDVRAALIRFVEEINADLGSLATGARGPCSKYELPDEQLAGRVELTFFDAIYNGVACNLESEGYKVMVSAFEEVYGQCKPYSITGSLPCIHELQEAGFDVQTIGFGKLATYHANNEYALLSDFEKGFRVMLKLIHKFSTAAA